MTEEYELSVYNRHELNYDHVALGRLPVTANRDPMIKSVRGLSYLEKGIIDRNTDFRTITNPPAN